MSRAFVSVGSNIDPAENVRRAIVMLARAASVSGISTVFRTEPVGSAGQPFFYNCIVEVTTELAPVALKRDVLRSIESALGRVRTGDRYAPRTIDLDLILYDDIVLAGKDLTLPDPDILTRSYLLAGLAELAPDLRMPGTGQRIADLNKAASGTGTEPLHDYTDVVRKEAFRDDEQP